MSQMPSEYDNQEYQVPGYPQQPQQPAQQPAQQGGMTPDQIAQWMRERGVSEHVIKDEANESLARYGDQLPGVLEGTLGQWLNRTNTTQSGQPAGFSGSSSGSSSSSSSSSSSTPTQPQQPAWFDQWFTDWRTRNDAEAAERKQRSDNLYDTWMGRAKQSLAIDRNDPVIRAQADAYSANQQRASRNYLSDLAESAGPLANLRGEQRMASERLGQATGTFEAELLGRELTARRNEIAQALTSMGGMLSADQQIGLQRELATLDQVIKQQGLDIQNRGLDIQNRGLDIDWQKALLSNSQFLADLGLRSENQYNYWNDPLRTR